MNGASAVVHNARFCLTPTSSSNFHAAKEGLVRTYPDLAEYLLQIYAIVDAIAKADAALTRHIQPQAIPPTLYEQELLTRSVTFGGVYKENVLKGIYM